MEGGKVCKQVRDQKSTGTSQRLIKYVWKQVKDGAQWIIITCGMKINSKAFVIPILTASGL